MTQSPARRLARLIAIAVPSLAAATVIVSYLQDRLGVPNPSAVYLVAVVATALVAGTSGAIVASVTSFLLYNFLFTEPRGTFSITDPAVLLGVFLLLFVGIVVGQLAALERTRTAIAQAREREARSLFQLSRELATRQSTAAVLPEIARVLAAETGMRRVWIALGGDDAAERVVADTADASGAESPVPAARFSSVLRRMPGSTPAEWVRVHQGSGSRSGGDTFRVRIEANGVSFGSIWCARERAASLPDRTATRLLAAAADQIGQALAQDRLAGASRAAEIAQQSDALKSALLQSVSHDLRTPLAAIRMAAGSLRPDSGLSVEARSESANAIEREVEHLNRLVTNLLDLSRIEAGALRVDREAVELEDVLARAIERLQPRLGDRPFELRLDAPPVEVDPVLVDAAFWNVVDNAIGHTPPSVPIRVVAEPGAEGFIRLTVEDGGSGVPDDALALIFEKFYRVPASGRTGAGTGIGLAVARGLIDAMGGRVTARRSTLGGLAIDIDLPVARLPAELRIGRP